MATASDMSREYLRTKTISLATMKIITLNDNLGLDKAVLELMYAFAKFAGDVTTNNNTLNFNNNTVTEYGGAVHVFC